MADFLENQRVGVLVDVSNLYHSARALYKGRVNFKSVLDEAVSGRQLIRAIAYVIAADVPEEKGFFEALKNTGFEVKSKDLQIFPGGVKKGDWDVGIAMDGVILAPKLDVLVLVTGDGDYVPFVSYLSKNRGVRVEVISFGRSTSQKLIEEADSFLDLDKDPARFVIKAPRR